MPDRSVLNVITTSLLSIALFFVLKVDRDLAVPTVLTNLEQHPRLLDRQNEAVFHSVAGSQDVGKAVVILEQGAAGFLVLKNADQTQRLDIGKFPSPAAEVASSISGMKGSGRPDV